MVLCVGAAITVGLSSTRAFSSDFPHYVQTETAAVRDSRDRLHVASETPFGTVIPVSNCEDSGSGSLRAAVDAAGDGDTVDASGLTCSVITLTSSGIATQEGSASVTVVGPGRDQLTIHADRNPNYVPHHVFTNAGTGVLTLRGMTITGGLVDVPAQYAYFRPLGGCVFAPVGSISLGDAALGESSGVLVTGCMVRGSDASEESPAGGAVYAAGTLSASYSTISGSTASGGAGNQAAAGGGLYAKGKLEVVHSVISGNSASGDPLSRGGGIVARGADSSITASTVRANTASIGGGIDAPGELTVDDSFISNNNASGSGGGMRVLGTLLLIDSTLSDNTAYIAGGLDGWGHIDIHGSTIDNNQAIQVGGLALRAQHARITNSTISGNTAESLIGGVFMQSIYDEYQMTMTGTTIADNTVVGNANHGAGIFATSVSLTLQSTLVSGNRTAGSEDDLNADIVVGGSNNLIGHPTDVAMVPDDTLLGVDPLLAPLADNGGPTRTQALLAGSPAIDGGSNAAGEPFDQRGAGFPRVVGADADIGAYEKNDQIFSDGFDR